MKLQNTRKKKKRGDTKIVSGKQGKAPHIRPEIQMALDFSGTNNSKLGEQCRQNAEGK